jgi:hypothetical protein
MFAVLCLIRSAARGAGSGGTPFSLFASVRLLSSIGLILYAGGGLCLLAGFGWRRFSLVGGAAASGRDKHRRKAHKSNN